MHTVGRMVFIKICVLGKFKTKQHYCSSGVFYLDTHTNFNYGSHKYTTVLFLTLLCLLQFCCAYVTSLLIKLPLPSYLYAFGHQIHHVTIQGWRTMSSSPPPSLLSPLSLSCSSIALIYFTLSI